MKKRKLRLKKKPAAQTSNIQRKLKLRGLDVQLGDEGLFGRHYPNSKIRKETISAILQIPEEKRSANEWWKLGEYTVFDGLMDENEQTVNDGVLALSRGASVEQPSLTCVLDLAWIQIQKGLPALALPYLEKLTSDAPTSRDAWSLLGHCHVKLGQPEKAIAAFRQAVILPDCTSMDTKTLKELEEGKDCSVIASNLILLKMHPDDMREMYGSYYSDLEIKKAVRFFLRMRFQLNQEDMVTIKNLGTIQYLLNEYKEAEKFLNLWLGKNADDAEVLTYLALIQQKHYKDDGAAIELYARAIAADDNFELALVNYASLLQEQGQYYRARPFLERALSLQGNKSHHALALDTYANNIAAIEEDFEKEAHFHRQAFSLEPNNYKFAGNYIVAALSAGMIDDALRFYSQHKNKLRRLSNFDLLDKMIGIFGNRTLDPQFFLFSAEKIRSLLGFKATLPLLSRAWKLRDNLGKFLDTKGMSDDQIREIEGGFFNELGVLVGKSGDHEFAIKIWKFIAERYDGSAILNQAVELSNLGRNEEALELVNVDLSEFGGRAYTVQGNIRMNAQLYLAAIESYKNAIEREHAFILPVINAIDCCKYLQQPSLLEYFVDKLKCDWKTHLEGSLSLAHAFSLQGKHVDAVDLYSSIIEVDNHFIDPDALFEKARGEKEDLTLLGSASIRDHKRLGFSLLISGQGEKLFGLIEAVRGWTKWVDGDWDVLAAEMYRRNNDTFKAIEIVREMQEQAPPLVTLALCNLELANYSEAKCLATRILESDFEAHNFNHPEGRPDAVAKSILALDLLESGKPNKSLDLAAEAIRRDVDCPIARTSYANANIVAGNPEEACRSLQEGLERRPGSPAMLRLLVETLLDLNRHVEATEALKSHRDLLSQNSALNLGDKLGELIALRRLSSYEKHVDFANLDMDWAFALSLPSQSWLKANLEIDAKSLNLPEASMFYLAKVVEKEYGDRIFYPFRDSLPNADECTSEEYSDISRFLTGDYAPSLGGMRRVLRAVSKMQSPDEPLLISKLRTFLSEISSINTKNLLDRAALDKLNSLGHVRNSLAHVGEPDVKRLNKYAEFVLVKNRPGPLLTAIGY